jgi:uncharacterized membrane protein YccC
LPKLPITLNLRAISVAEGLRAGIAVAVTLIIGQVFNLPYFGLAALGALLTCFADPGGPIARRAPAVIAFALCSGITYGVFGLLRGQGAWIAAPLAGLMIFCASFARIYGQGGMQVGNLLSVVTVLALDMPDHDFTQALGQGFNLCAGAAWAALLTLVIWRVYPYAPARRALADVAQKLSLFAKDLAHLANETETLAGFEQHATRHRRDVREAIETARDVALETFRRRGLATPRGAQLSLRLQALEHLFSALIALSDSLENDAAGRAALVEPLRYIAAWLAGLGPDIEADRALDSSQNKSSLQWLRDSLEKLPQNAEQRRILHAIAENFAVLVAISTPGAGVLPSFASPQPLRGRILSPVRQNLNFGSIPMRHALRAAVIATPVLAWTMLHGGLFAHWATITLVLCLQPYFSATWTRTAARVAGTAIGGLFAAGIGLLAQTQIELALAMLPLTVFAFSIRSVSYGVFIAALTPMVVLLVEQIGPGADELHIAFLRVGFTLAGGALAVFGNLVLWPSFEGARLEQAIAAATASHAVYARAVFAALLDGGPAPDAQRRGAGMASNNLEAALARALLEPHKRRDPLIERGAVVNAALRRMAGRLSVLALDRPALSPASGKLWQAWADWLGHCLAGQISARPALPDGPGADALIRLARQVELIAA